MTSSSIDVHKAQAKRFRQIIKNEFNDEITHSQALEYIARINGVKDWNTLVGINAKDSNIIKPVINRKGTRFDVAKGLRGLGYVSSIIEQIQDQMDNGGLVLFSGGVNSGKSTAISSILKSANKSGASSFSFDQYIKEIGIEKIYTEGLDSVLKKAFDVVNFGVVRSGDFFFNIYMPGLLLRGVSCMAEIHAGDAHYSAFKRFYGFIDSIENVESREFFYRIINTLVEQRRVLVVNQRLSTDKTLVSTSFVPNKLTIESMNSGS